MNKLLLENVDLISIQRAAPHNGASSSSDYNDSSREILRDLVSITDFINEKLLPMLNDLPEDAKGGLNGSTVYAKPGDTATLFYNAKTNAPFTLAEVCQNLFSSNGALGQRINDLNGRVLKLQALLATTGQTDLLASVQSFSDQIKNLGAMINTVKASLGGYEARFQQTKAVRMEVPATESHEFQQMDVSWDIPYKTNDYTVVASVEDQTGSFQITGWYKLTNGRGIQVAVYNASAGPVEGAMIHVIGQSDAAATA